MSRGAEPTEDRSLLFAEPVVVPPQARAVRREAPPKPKAWDARETLLQIL